MELKEFLWSLVIIYVFARAFGELAVRVGQSSVLGELLAGILVGAGVFGWIEPTPTLRLMGEIGVMLLLFEVGLESDLQSFLRVGREATLVAAIGVVTPFILGYGIARVFHMSQLQAIFIGATLTATSVAISARVLSDLGQLKTPEGNIILGAAVLDDIIGLVTLSVIVGLAESGVVSWFDIGWTAGIAMIFLTGAIIIGIRYVHLFSHFVNRMRTRGRLVIMATTFALFLGYLAELLHIAPLVGAFAAGLVLARTEHQTKIGELIKPVADVFVPIFFVLVGVAADLRHLNPFHAQNGPVLMLAGALILAAIFGKVMSGLGALGKPVNRWAIGVGMLPRGEVGLIFAGVGLSHHIIAEGAYGAVLAVVVVTTFVSPLLLKSAFKAPARTKQFGD
ncbi:MAG: cation:proton antiporter [Nitrospiraceae bacterium]